MERRWRRGVGWMDVTYQTELAGQQGKLRDKVLQDRNLLAQAPLPASFPEHVVSSFSTST